MSFDINKMSPNFRVGLKRFRTPMGVEFVASNDEGAHLVWIQGPPLPMTSDLDSYGYGLGDIMFGDVVLHPWGEDGDEGNILVYAPDGTVEVPI